MTTSFLGSVFRITQEGCKKRETHWPQGRTGQGPEPGSNSVDELLFYGTFGAAVACAFVFGVGWRRDRLRLTRLQDRLFEGHGSGDLEQRVDDLAHRVAQLARGQEFLQQFLAGNRRLPHADRAVETKS